MNPARPHSPKRSTALPLLVSIVPLIALAGMLLGVTRPAGTSHPRAGAAWALASFSQPQPGPEPESEPESEPSLGPAPGPESVPQSNDDAQDPSDEGIRECIITLLSGRTITGELIRQDSLIVVIGINGIDTTFQKKSVAQVKVLAPVAERYQAMRAATADDDIDARLSLVEWLRARKAYTLALNELDSILTIDPKNPRAKLLHTWLAEYGKLRRTDPEQPNTPQQQTPVPDNTQEDTERTLKFNRNQFPTLTPEQINLMRVYEIDLRQPPKVRVPDEVITELMARSPESFSPNKDERSRNYQLPEIDKLKLLFTLKARDLYSKVEVLGTPRSLANFKDDVHNRRGWLINACASTRCHGGTEAGSFRLLNTKPNSDETAFTNLYIIEHTTLADGTPLINYKTPDRSPLLQMGMVRGNALTPHPEIPRDFPGIGWRPIFRTTRDRKYQQALDWIRSMYQPRPDYGFDYQPYPLDPSPDPNAAPSPARPGSDMTNTTPAHLPDTAPAQSPPDTGPKGP